MKLKSLTEITYYMYITVLCSLIISLSINISISHLSIHPSIHPSIHQPLLPQLKTFSNAPMVWATFIEHIIFYTEVHIKIKTFCLQGTENHMLLLLEHKIQVYEHPKTAFTHVCIVHSNILYWTVPSGHLFQLAITGS
jgi:hypothetical protein